MDELDIEDLYERSNNDIVSELGERFRSYRIALRLTQKDVAEQSGVSVMTVVRFEKGEGGSIRLDTFVSLLRAVQRLEGIVESIP
ncbi:MAG: helix-turn-helix domain-containing protein, partial [Bacteroidales bacterium]|nr:helix-turn-helix domain-containing protein [Bacteroidales bacterium]